ncbi:MAG: GH3 auxin-responsive promoter family protein, partial [Alistipes sp.]|nr:GH3 auxin-responsive promoter family protein [Alistipes sp.]
CRATGARVSEDSVAPCYMSLQQRGAHEWFVEFEQEPDDRERFAEALDEALRAANSDYDAKRLTTLDRQRLTVLPAGTFLRWMRANRKNKVPRLVNDRRVADGLTHE